MFYVVADKLDKLSSALLMVVMTDRENIGAINTTAARLAVQSLLLSNF